MFRDILATQKIIPEELIKNLQFPFVVGAAWKTSNLYGNKSSFFTDDDAVSKTVEAEVHKNVLLKKSMEQTQLWQIKTAHLHFHHLNKIVPLHFQMLIKKSTAAAIFSNKTCMKIYCPKLKSHSHKRKYLPNLITTRIPFHSLRLSTITTTFTTQENLRLGQQHSV